MEYRAPPYDLWQLGLTCYTLATGQDLFAPAPGPRYDITDKHLGEMTGVLGRLPREVRTAWVCSLHQARQALLFDESRACDGE